MLKILMALTGAVCALMSFAASVATQTCGAGLRGAQKIESDNYVLAYRTQPAKITVGKHFSIDLVMCAKGNAAMPDGVTVDAYMPEHGHGMNYKAAVKPAGNDKAVAKPAGKDEAALKPAVDDARYRADGLMFHMPGRWDLTFELRGAGKAERLTRSIVLE